MRKKKFQETPIQIDNSTDLEKLKVEYSWSQYISSTCEKCDKIFQRRLAHTDILLCRNCQRELSCLKKYGVPHHNQLSEIKEKRKQTCLDKFGYSTNLQCEDIKEKIRCTNIQKYGVEYPMQSQMVKDKSIKTCLKKYGVENTHQIDFVIEKTKQTNLKRYGTINPLQSQDILERIKQTNLEKYGVDSFSKTDKFKNRIAEVGRLRWANMSGEEKRKVRQKQSNKWKLMWEDGGSLREKWNNLSDEEKRKIRQKQSAQLKLCWGLNGVLRKRWDDMTEEELADFRKKCSTQAVINWQNMSDQKRLEIGEKISTHWKNIPEDQKLEIRQKQSQKYKYNEINFDSSWELAYFLYLIDNNIDFEYQCEPIEYQDLDGKNHYWFPDFKVGDQYIEIKGDHFFDRETGVFINPFKRNEIEDAHNLSKYQCMLDNNTIILKSEEMKPILEHVKIKYGKTFLENCRLKHNKVK